jgi:transcriptional regulator
MKSFLYNPSPFHERDYSIVREFIQAHPFATVISQNDEGLIVSHIPMLIEPGSEPLQLVGHVARKNPHGESLRQCNPVLVIFGGPNSYVSPSLYEDPVAIPTINYIALHVRGKPRPIDDPSRTLQHLETLIQHYEGSDNGRWDISLLPREFVTKALYGIVAFEVTATSIEGKFKLSQNKSETDRSRVMEAFASSSSPPSTEIAAWMRRAQRQDP